MRSYLMTKSPFKYESIKSPTTFLTQCEILLKLRGEQYGSYIDLFKRKAQRFSFASGEKISPSTVARMMAEMKLARLDLNNFDEDTLVDCINYLCLYGACVSVEHTQGKETPQKEKKQKTISDYNFSDILNKPTSG